MRKMCLFLAMSLVTVFLLTNPPVSMANVRVEWNTGTGSGGAFYARIEWEWTLHTDEWAAVPFYRDPDCVPEDFNLLDVFDFENATSCHSYVEGFEIWKNGPWAGDLGPIQVKLKAAEPMPIYFVPWSVMEAARGDGVLTMPELEVLSGAQVGIATFYTETLHPYMVAQQTMIEIVAKGYMELDNNVQFELKSTWIHEDPTTHDKAKIDFKPAKSAPALSSQSKLAVTWGEMKGK